jgi:hypothetical protein
VTEEKKRNIKVVWIVLICAAITAACVLLYVLMNQKNTAADASPTPTAAVTASASASASAVSEYADVAVTSNSYEAYNLDDLDFGFIIADIHVATTKNITIPFSSFTTNEGIKLSEISSYTDALTEHSYTLEKENLASELKASGTGFDARILIPYKNKSASSITLKCDFNEKNNLTFDVTKADTTGETLKVKETPAPEEKQTFNVSIDSVQEVDPSYVKKNDSTYFMPSTARIYAFHVVVTAAQGEPVTITSASFDTSDYGSMDAESSNIHTDEFANMIGKTVTGTDDGYLFIMMLDPGHSITSINGQMELHMADSSQDTTLNVTLQ